MKSTQEGIRLGIVCLQLDIFPSLVSSVIFILRVRYTGG
jgi:hypothetical protein